MPTFLRGAPLKQFDGDLLMKLSADVVVIGCGAVGLATVFELSKLGCKVVGIEQHQIGHDKGSSHGETRAIRKAYFENPAYVPLLNEAYNLWDELQQLTHTELFVRTGVLQIGPKDSRVLSGSILAAKEHKIDIEELSSNEINERFTGLTINDDMSGVFEPDAGYIFIDKVISLLSLLSRNFAATLLETEKVIHWKKNNIGQICVVTNKRTITCERLVITTGGWASNLLADLSLPLAIVQKGLYWFEACELHTSKHLPTFLFDSPASAFYGFPSYNNHIKIARHSGGKIISLPEDATTDDKELKEISEFAIKHLRGINSPPRKKGVCFYTLTPDENFIIDFHPQFENIVFATGLSGHGFKMSNVLGQYLAQMVTVGYKPKHMNFLSLDRFKNLK